MCGRGGGAKYVVFFMNFTFRYGAQNETYIED